jgi:dolichol-phosphate mannosyltransferase
MSENASLNMLGIVIPCYNESDNIALLVSTIREQVPDALIAVVDDSPDTRTVDAVSALGLHGVEAVHRAAKGGRGSAVVEGIGILLGRAHGPIMEMDADFSHPPSQIPELVAHFRDNGLDMLIASRYLPESRIEN